MPARTRSYNGVCLSTPQCPQRLFGLVEALLNVFNPLQQRFPGFRRISARDDVQPGQHPLSVGKVADDLAEGKRQLLDEHRGNYDLFRLDLFRVLIYVDHFKVVTAMQPLFAKRPNVLNGAGRSRRAAADEEP